MADESNKPWQEQFPDELLDELRRPDTTMPAFGKVVDQESGKIHDFNPNKIAPALQYTLLDFYSRTPRTPAGHKKFLAVLSSRQVGKTLVAADCVYVRTAYTPGTYSAVIADTKPRAVDLFRNITLLHEHMPDEVRMPTIPNRESRQLTFLHGGVIRTLSAESNMVGIGRAVDNLHMSELPFWPDAATAWNGILPAIINRKEASVLMESTPAPLTFPSAAWYRDICAEARRGVGRWLFCFVPFFQSRLNERPWGAGWTMTSEETRLLDRFGPDARQWEGRYSGLPISAPGAQYLTLENLAFRREIMDMDPEVRRHPELFKVYYPTDPISCWVQAGGAAIPEHALEKHRDGILVPWGKGESFKRYLDPKPGAIYIIGVDPAGWLGGDQASFQVLELWEDRWEQAAVFSSNEIDPIRLSELLIAEAAHYNHATVAVEDTGVGQGVIAMLTQAYEAGELKNLFFSTRGKGAAPGIPASKPRIGKALGLLIDALMDRLVLHDMETVDQLGTYRNDKLVQDNEAKGILTPGAIGKGRRAKHHWDRCSALLWAVYAAHSLPVRFRPQGVREAQGEAFDEDKTAWTAEEWHAHLVQVKKDEERSKRERRKAARRERGASASLKKQKKTKRPRRPHWSKR